MSSYSRFLSRNAMPHSSQKSWPKKIAIRKVFGGTMQSEIRRNLKEYIIMILIANAIAIGSVLWQIVSVARVNLVMALKKE